MPGERRTIYVEALAESLEAAIDGAKDELERQISVQKGKRFSKFLRAARSVKEEFHITSLARRALGVYHWIRRNKKEEGE